MTGNINESLSTIYIMEMKIYRKTMLHTHLVTPVPFTKMYTLEEFSSGKAWSPVKRENPCYFESKGTMRPESQGGETKQIKITIPKRSFIAKKYPVGTPQDPFEKNKIESEINDRFYHYLTLIRIGQVYVDLLHFFTVCKWIVLMYMHKLPGNCGGMERLK
ncbi:hypothetical protein [Phytobacter sp. V91]|uniref:hypothetical protein n=1 Tax=Phytobacter sp. V91 TaxID=3369425 RepID=UPI003F621C45